MEYHTMSTSSYYDASQGLWVKPLIPLPCSALCSQPRMSNTCYLTAWAPFGLGKAQKASLALPAALVAYLNPPPPYCLHLICSLSPKLLSASYSPHKLTLAQCVCVCGTRASVLEHSGFDQYTSNILLPICLYILSLSACIISPVCLQAHVCLIWLILSCSNSALLLELSFGVSHSTPLFYLLTHLFEWKEKKNVLNVQDIYLSFMIIGCYFHFCWQHTVVFTCKCVLVCLSLQGLLC